MELHGLPPVPVRAAFAAPPVDVHPAGCFLLLFYIPGRLLAICFWGAGSFSVVYIVVFCRNGVRLCLHFFVFIRIAFSPV
jgi:hypothetical protein